SAIARSAARRSLPGTCRPPATSRAPPGAPRGCPPPRGRPRLPPGPSPPAPPKPSPGVVRRRPRQIQLPALLTVYYGRRRMLTLAPSMVLDRATSPYRRLSATLFLACRAPFPLEVGDGITLPARAALLAPKVRRRRTVALDSGIVIFDIPIGTPEYA